jgi:hypothetical protein
MVITYRMISPTSNKPDSRLQALLSPTSFEGLRRSDL